MTSQAGYTLTEMLVALVVLALAIGGLAQATAVIGKRQSSIVGLADRARSLGEVQDKLSALVAAPCDSTKLSGDREQLALPCSGGARAQITVQRSILQFHGADRDDRIELGGSAHLQYLTSNGVYPRWPTVTEDGSRLRGIELAAASGETLAYAPVYRQEARPCDYDPISLRCRGQR